MSDLYRARKLAQGYPGLPRLAFETYAATVAAEADQTPLLEKRLVLLDRLVDLTALSRILVLGCGPRPQAIKVLLEKGYDVVGVDVMSDFVEAAREYLEIPERVVEG